MHLGKPMVNSTISASAPKTAEDLVQEARELMNSKKPDEARQRLEASLALKETAPAYRNLGNIRFMGRDFKGSVPFFQQALKVDAKDHASYAMLAETHFAMGDAAAALQFSVQAIAAGPNEILYKERFVFMSQSAVFKQYSDVIENTILACLETPALDCSGLQGIWYNTFTLNPAYSAVYPLKSAQSGGFLSNLKSLVGAPSADRSFDAAAFEKVKDFTPLLRPFFLLALQRLTVYSAAFETFATQLRRALMLQPERFTKQEHLLLSVAMSHYAYNTEYILDVTPEEERALAACDNIALYACYAPLYKSKKMRAFAEQATAPELASLLAVQMENESKLDEARSGIPALTPISDEVSKMVREQYEESPYPKWSTIPRNLLLEAVAAPLRKPGAKILVAGCGTGQEAAQMASVLPEAEILAVDLSLSSLAYAKLQTAALGFKNITFGQADILQLGVLPQRFDAIISGGVLHHMKDPVAGWKVLTGLLNENGLMRIALYSKLARKHIYAAREAVARGNFPATPEGMRLFRKESPRLLPKDTLSRLMAVSDYYHISMYRDMVFHVQEHCFDLPELATVLKQLQLEFVKMILPPAVMAQYLNTFPNDRDGVSLENWHKFEQAQPDTFLGMYQFWCRKTKG